MKKDPKEEESKEFVVESRLKTMAPSNHIN